MGEPTWGWAEDDWGELPARRSLATRVARLALDHAPSLALGLLGAGLLPYRSGIGAALLAAAISLIFGRTDFNSARQLWRADGDRTCGRLSAGIYLAAGLSRAGGAAFIATGATVILAPAVRRIVGVPLRERWPVPLEFYWSLSTCCLLLLASWTIAFGSIAGCLRHGRRIQLVETTRKPGSTLASKRAGECEPPAAEELSSLLVGSIGVGMFCGVPIGMACIVSGLFDEIWPILPIVNQPSMILRDWIDRNLPRFILSCGAASLTLFVCSTASMAVLLKRILPSHPMLDRQSLGEVGAGEAGR